MSKLIVFENPVRFFFCRPQTKVKAGSRPASLAHAPAASRRGKSAAAGTCPTPRVEPGASAPPRSQGARRDTLPRSACAAPRRPPGAQRARGGARGPGRARRAAGEARCACAACCAAARLPCSPGSQAGLSAARARTRGVLSVPAGCLLWFKSRRRGGQAQPSGPRRAAP